jgi:hypothetical protein
MGLDDMASPSFFETIDALLTLFSMTHATTCGRYIARTGTEQLCKRYFQDRVSLWFPHNTRLLGPGLDHHRLALSFGPALDQDAAVPLPRLRRKQRWIIR